LAKILHIFLMKEKNNRKGKEESLNQPPFKGGYEK
jgi:hypothetical protein